MVGQAGHAGPSYPDTWTPDGAVCLTWTPRKAGPWPYAGPHTFVQNKIQWASFNLQQFLHIPIQNASCLV